MKVKNNDDFVIGKNLEKNKVNVDLSKVQDLYDEDEILNEIELADDLVIEEEKENKKKKRLPKKVLEQVQAEEFAKEYARVGGI